MATTNLNIRTEKEIKDQAEAIFSELGLNMTTAINLFLRTTIRENGIPFNLKLEAPNHTIGSCMKFNLIPTTQFKKDLKLAKNKIKIWINCLKSLLCCLKV